MVTAESKAMRSPTHGQELAFFAALGSRGDVQPLLLIAKRWLESDSKHTLLFCTHQELAPLCKSVLGEEYEKNYVSYIKESCFLGAFTVDIHNPLDVVDVGRRRQAEWMALAPLAEHAHVVVCNIFALPPCLHAGEKYQVPLVCCSPSLMPYQCPEDFEVLFRIEYPDVYDYISVTDVYRFIAKSKEEPMSKEVHSKIGWRTVMDWLWPMFTASHGAFREYFLGLPSTPYLCRNGIYEPFCVPPRFVMGVEERFLLDSFKATQTTKETIVGVPHIAELVGFWFDPTLFRNKKTDFRMRDSEEDHQSASSAYASRDGEGEDKVMPIASLDVPDIVKNAISGERTTVWISFGSMLHLLPEELTNSWEDSFVELARTCDVVVQWKGVTQKINGVVFLSKDVNVVHDDVFKYVDVVVHHGGVGTVAACLRSAVPQIICPIAYDQFYWAYTIRHLGIGDHCEGESMDLKKIVQNIMNSEDEFRRKCVEISNRILESSKGSLDRTVKVIQESVNAGVAAHTKRADQFGMADESRASGTVDAAMTRIVKKKIPPDYDIVRIRGGGDCCQVACNDIILLGPSPIEVFNHFS